MFFRNGGGIGIIILGVGVGFIVSGLANGDIFGDGGDNIAGLLITSGELMPGEILGDLGEGMTGDLGEGPNKLGDFELGVLLDLDEPKIDFALGTTSSGLDEPSELELNPLDFALNLVEPKGLDLDDTALLLDNGDLNPLTFTLDDIEL